MTVERVPIVVTLRPSVSDNFLRQCKEAGADVVRIATGKMSPEQAVELYQKVGHVPGLGTLVDLAGPGSRVTLSTAMEEVKDDQKEQGSRRTNLQPNDQLILIKATKEEIERRKRMAQIHTIGVTFLPSEIYQGEYLGLDENGAKCLVSEVKLSNSQGRNIESVSLRVVDVGKEWLYWGVKVLSLSGRNFHSDGPIVTERDQEVLTRLKRSHSNPRELAFSFVDTANRLGEALEIVGKMNFKPRPIFNAKLETPAALEVSNLAEICKMVDKVTIARGDLSQLYGNGVFGIQETIMRDLKGMVNRQGQRIRFDIATLFVESMEEQAKNGQNINWNNQTEIGRWQHESQLLGLDRVWITSPTMTTGSLAVNIINEFAKARI